VLTPLTCVRVAYEAGRGICLAQTRSLPTPAYTAEVFDRSLRVTHTFPLNGTPSRTRVSPDGRYGASTTFVAGDSYTNVGQFSTRTTIYDLVTGRSLGSLEDFAVSIDGRQVKRADFNFWGVTFARPSIRFYATLLTAGTTYLVQGDLRTRTLRAIHRNVECPSLSPDGTRIAYKKRVGSPAVWRFTVLDLRTMRETPLAETRPLDDQIEWLDNAHVLYDYGEEVWIVSADGRGTPRRYLPRAASPAVVR
jgi:hypothetical protein